MGQLDFWVTWIPEGQTEEEALNSHSDGDISFDDDGVPEMGPADPGPNPPAPSAEIDVFLLDAIDKLRAFEPTLAEDESERKLVGDHLRVVEFTDDLDHWIHLSPGQAWLQPNSIDAETFGRLWGYLQILAGLAPSVCELDYSSLGEVDRVDTTLDVEQALDIYGWE